MSFRLIDNGWQSEIDQALQIDGSNVSLVSPFIKFRVVERILARIQPQSMRVITRFCLDDFVNGVSDIEALELLAKHGAQIRGVKNLHAKLYIFGNRSVIITSANLTGAGLRSNHEFGCSASEPNVIAECQSYFNLRWSSAARATLNQMTQWRSTVISYQANYGRLDLRPILSDYGAEQIDVEGDIPSPINLPIRISDSERGFVKFFGTSKRRANRTETILDEVTASTSHAVLSYPIGKRPRQIQDGDTCL